MPTSRRTLVCKLPGPCPLTIIVSRAMPFVYDRFVTICVCFCNVQSSPTASTKTIYNTLHSTLDRLRDVYVVYGDVYGDVYENVYATSTRTTCLFWAAFGLPRVSGTCCCCFFSSAKLTLVSQVSLKLLSVCTVAYP